VNYTFYPGKALCLKFAKISNEILMRVDGLFDVVLLIATLIKIIG